MIDFNGFFLRTVLIPLLVFANTAILFAQNDEVFLTTGEFYKGEIISIGPELMLIKTEDRVFSVRRDQIKLVFRSHQEVEYTETSTVVPFTPVPYVFDTLDRIYLIELGGGLYTFSNFALSMHAIHWFRLDPNWSLGAMFGLDFSRYVMFKMGPQLKYTVRLKQDIASYFLAGASVSPWAEYFVDEASWQVESKTFSPIFQTNIGGGFWYDTGMKIAFTGEGGLALTRFTLEESFGSWTGEQRSQTINALNIGPYFRLGMAF